MKVANDGQLTHLEDHVHTPAGSVRCEHSRFRLVEEVQRQQLFEIAFQCSWIINVTGPGLDVVETVFVTQATVTGNIN